MTLWGENNNKNSAFSPLSFCLSAEVWFQNLNTGEDTGLNQKFSSFGKDSRLACMTG